MPRAALAAPELGPSQDDFYIYLGGADEDGTHRIGVGRRVSRVQ